jgi:hypothetical protein
MDETLIGVVMGVAVLSIASLLVAVHYRREHLRRRMLYTMHGRRLHEFTRHHH